MVEKLQVVAGSENRAPSRILTANGQLTPEAEVWLSALESKIDQALPMKTILNDLDLLIGEINSQIRRANLERNSTKSRTLRLIRQRLESITMHVYQFEVRVIASLYTTLAVLVLKSFTDNPNRDVELMGVFILLGAFMLLYYEVLADSKESSKDMDPTRMGVKSDIKKIKQELTRAFTE